MSRPIRNIAPRQRHRRATLQPGQAEPAYPAGDYATNAHDALGRSTKVAIQVPPIIRRAASRLVALQKFPFETEQDVLRFCLFKGLELLSNRAKDGEITSDVAILKAANASARVNLDHVLYAASFDLQAQQIRVLIDRGYAKYALEIAETLWMEYDKIEHQHWRGIFRERAKKLLDATREAAVEAEKVKSNGHNGHRRASVASVASIAERRRG